MFKKIQFKIEILVSYLKQKIFFILIGIIIGTLGFVGRNQIINTYNLPSFHTRTIGVEGLYNTSNLPDEISNQITYGLTIISEKDKPSLSPIVESYDVQDNGKDYIFTLKPGMYWQDGKKFTAYDINYNIEGLNLTPLSENKIKITLQKEFSPLLSLLSQPILRKKVIGLGPYEVKKITYQEGNIKTLKLKPRNNDQYNLLYRFYANEKDLADAFKLGDVDEIKIYGFKDEFSNWKNLKISQEIQTNTKYSAVFFNTQKLGSKPLRQALAYATPKTKDRNERCLGPISPISWAYNPTIKDYDYNPTRAKELFENNNIEKIHLSVNDRRLLPLAENIKNAWSEILKIETIITIENQLDLENYEAVLTYGYIPQDPDQYTFWHSTQTKTNITKLDNSRIDKLLEEGRLISDYQERKKIYMDFQKYLLEESPAIFISYPTAYTINRIK